MGTLLLALRLEKGRYGELRPKSGLAVSILMPRNWSGLLLNPARGREGEIATVAYLHEATQAQS